jgi:cytochrome c553
LQCSAEEAKPAASKKADPAKGEALYTNGDAARNIPACASPATALPAIPRSPKSKDGGSARSAIFSKQLTNFKGSERNNPVMTSIAKALTERGHAKHRRLSRCQAVKAGCGAQNKEGD